MTGARRYICVLVIYVKSIYFVFGDKFMVVSLHVLDLKFEIWHSHNYPQDLYEHIHQLFFFFLHSHFVVKC